MYGLTYSVEFDPDLAKVKSVPKALLTHLTKCHQGLARFEMLATWYDENEEQASDPELFNAEADTDDAAEIAGSVPRFDPEEIANHVTFVCLALIRDTVEAEELWPDSVVSFRLTSWVVTTGTDGEPRQTAKSVKFELSAEDVDEEDEGEEDDDGDEGEEGEEGEEEEEEEEGEEKPKKKKRKPKKSNKERYAEHVERKRRKSGIEGRDEAQREREARHEEREERVGRRIGAGYGIADRLRGPGLMGPGNRPMMRSEIPRLQGPAAETELIGVIREFKEMFSSQHQAIETERKSLDVMRSELFAETRRTMEEVRKHYGCLHDVDIETIREANRAQNEMSRSIGDVMKHQREIASSGWGAWKVGMQMQQAGMMAITGVDKQILELKVGQMEKDHQRALAEAEEKPEEKKGGGFMESFIKLIEVATPLVMAKLTAPGDLDAEEDGIKESMGMVAKMRDASRPNVEAEVVENKPSIPKKPARVVRPDAEPVAKEPAAPRPVLPADEPPVAAMSLPSGFANFEEFEAKLPVVSRLRLLITWLTPEQSVKVEEILGAGWPKVVKAAGATSDKDAILGMLELRGKFANKTTEQLLHQTLTAQQIELFDDIAKTIRKRLAKAMK